VHRKIDPRDKLRTAKLITADAAFEFSILEPDHFQDETTGSEQIARLHDFTRTIGHLLNKVIILTPQALTQFPLFRFDPKTGEEHWFLENTETRE
jgi:hypothetical protein